MDQRLSQDRLGVPRLTAGILSGIALTVMLYGAVKLLTLYKVSVSGSPVAIATTILAVLAWAISATSIGAVAGKIAGRLEVPVAAGSGVVGLIVSNYLPNSFGDPAILLFSAIPFLLFITVGGMLVFFARRTDLR